MSDHRADICWQRDGKDFGYENYSRNHDWYFPDSDVTVAGSAATHYLGDGDRVDPEEAFVASVSSCHMLTFLAIASRKRFVVDRYDDAAVGLMAPNSQDRLAIVEVKLAPKIVFSGARKPDAQAMARMHHLAHEECFIANSVKCRITVT